MSRRSNPKTVNMIKKVLLARPNPFIVNEMQGFIKDCEFDPTPLHDLEQLSNYDRNEVAGIVISTAVNSTVKENFTETLKEVIDTYPALPIVIATLMPTDKIKKTTDFFLQNNSFNHELHSVQEVLTKNKLEPKNTMLILEKSMLIDQSHYSHSKEIIQSFFD
ncbi:MAG: hypothetical protein OCD76_14215 [Reichenbachiella sp.]